MVSAHRGTRLGSLQRSDLMTNNTLRLAAKTEFLHDAVKLV